MKKILLTVAILLVASANKANATLIEATYEAALDGGYRAEGTIIYDDSIPLASGFLLGPTNGINYLDVDFFDPSNDLIQSVVNVSGGVSTYQYLEVYFDTTIPNFADGESMDIGQDNGVDGDTYLSVNSSGTARLRQIEFFNANILSTTPNVTFDITVVGEVPEPTTLALAGLGMLGMGWRRRMLA